MVTKDNSSEIAKGLEAWKEYFMLNSYPKVQLDNLTFLAARFCKTAASLITFVDGDIESVKSSFGIAACEVGPDTSFGRQVLKRGIPFLVNDIGNDSRFQNHPWLKEKPKMSFYAGVPLVTSDGTSIGVLCVLDKQSHQLDDIQVDALNRLASQVTAILELGKRIIELENFTSKAAHNIKSPLCSISMMTELFREMYSGQMDPEGIELLSTINDSTNQLAQSIDEILNRKKK
ncbi:MAG: GAF domain-containing protein [Prolixibacteraceae bacterium]